jgi:hypothetical protein
MPPHQACCSCGKLSLKVDGDPARVSVCHCLACQRRTGSAFGIQARYPRDQVQIAGPSRAYARTGDSGQIITYHFCAGCGTTLYWELADLPDMIAVAVGAFADPTFLTPQVSVYGSRRHPWVDISGPVRRES